MDNEKKKRLAELRDSMKSYGYMDGVEELEDIFPEIKENEDEGIRKFIIDCIDELRKANAENADFNGCCSEAIAYLEKHTESTWTAEDESFVKHILPRILNPDKWTLDQRTADKKYLTEFIERQKRKYAKEQQPAEWNEDERIVSIIKNIIEGVKGGSTLKIAAKDANDCIAYLERQKEQKPKLPKPHKGDDTNPYDMGVSEAQDYAINRGFDIPLNDGEVFVDERYITQTIGNILRWADEHPKEQKPTGWEWPNLSNCIRNCKKCHGKCFYRKEPYEWSEEDIKKIRSEEYTKGFNDAAFGGKLKEWSEEDEKMIERLIRHTQEEYNELCNDRYGHQEIVSDLKKSCRERMNWLENRLKSLRPQPKQEWSEEEKERIRQNGRLDVCYNPEKYGLCHKTEWGEGEMEVLDSIINDYEMAAKSFCGHDGKIMFLKAIRNGEYGLSKQEWGEEDNIIKNVISYLNGEYGFKSDDDEYAYRKGLVRQLKSLHLQPISQPSTNHTVWHNASEEKPTKLPIIHIWYHGNRVSAVVTHENIGLQEELDDINFQPDDKWAYVEDLLNVQPHWKPIEEQMVVLYDAISNLKHDNYKNIDVLESLYAELKKL